MSAIFPTAIAGTLDLLTAINNTKVTLNVDAGIGDTTLTVDDASPLPSSGYLTFDDNESNPESVYYTGKSGNNLTGVTRAADSTAAGTHSTGAHLEQRWNAAYHNVLVTEMIAIEQNLSDRFGLDSGTHYAKHVDGAVATPSITFAADTNTGLYRIGADDVAIATGGVKALEVNATQQVIIPKTSSQIILGVTNTSTISATAPTASRVLTIPDPGADASFVMTQGAQTIAGTKTFSSSIVMSSANISGATYFSGSSGLFTGNSFPASGVGIGIGYASGSSKGFIQAYDIGLNAYKALEIDTTTLTVTNGGGTTLLTVQSSGILTPDGALGGPAMSFIADPTTGFYRNGSGIVSYVGTGVRSLEFLPITTADDTEQVPLEWFGGSGSNAGGLVKYTTSGVTTSAKKIGRMDFDAGEALVIGTDGTNWFCDKIIGFDVTTTAPTVIGSSTKASPAARTYTAASGQVKVTMGSGTYTVSFQCFGVNFR